MQGLSRRESLERIEPPLVDGLGPGVSPNDGEYGDTLFRPK